MERKDDYANKENRRQTKEIEKKQDIEDKPMQKSTVQQSIIYLKPIIVRNRPNLNLLN